MKKSRVEVKMKNQYCDSVMLYLWRGCRPNLKLITLGREKGLTRPIQLGCYVQVQPGANLEKHRDHVYFRPLSADCQPKPIDWWSINSRPIVGRQLVDGSIDSQPTFFFTNSQQTVDQQLVARMTVGEQSADGWLYDNDGGLRSWCLQEGSCVL